MSHRSSRARRALLVSASAVCLIAPAAHAQAGISSETSQASAALASPVIFGVTATSTDTSVALKWAPVVVGGDEVVSYRCDIYVDAKKVATVRGTSATIPDLEPDTAYQFVVECLDEQGQIVRRGTVTVKTKSVDSAPLTVNYGVTGSAAIGTLLRGAIPQKGGAGLLFTGSKGHRTVQGNVTLGTVEGTLAGPGFLPVPVKVAFVNGAGEGSGTLENGKLTLTQKVRIKVVEVLLKTFVPLPLPGNNCQTKKLTELTLSSDGSSFDEVQGGALTGTFAISDLNGCAVLEGLVSPLTAGDGNTISLNLTPSA